MSSNTCTSDISGEAASLGKRFRKVLASLQDWASDPINSARTMHGSQTILTPTSETALNYRNGRDCRHEESENIDSVPFLVALKEELGRAIYVCSARQGFNCAIATQSHDLSSQNSEEDMIHRLGSWGTFATAATEDSIETKINELAELYDDDGFRIDALLAEKARLKRELARTSSERKRVVKFEYPPVSTLRECPRPAPEDMEHLFFTTEELDTFEEDRRCTSIVDDVEIVAVSSSSSAEAPGKLKTSIDDPETSVHGFGKHVPTPKKKAGRDRESSRSRTENEGNEGTPRWKRKSFTPQSPRLGSAFFDGDEGEESFVGSLPSPANKPLLKSVQIFLRERSVKAL